MLHVTCAIIIKNNQVLICQRSEKMRLPLKWEFPGGKVESGESLAHCIVREIKEELLIDIRVLEAYTPVTHSYPDGTLTLYPFVCLFIGGDLRPTEHAQAIWVAIDDLLQYDWADADIPIVKELLAKYRAV
ncbi:(deoxy)nucleoside triphosphate pyrophosphohydrolase [Olivibacter sp. XZL3]|uniref:(deoxy)nucleoside triphosphate pyrophosphohydrolase n=1 Tax=Olivibacter sp. XZL3 TaxID=1735116 RepID=UPI001065D3E1|nr:(deoxy)nucleoside triphosphate pyrophosphohydrolase [Olivibacter sp. XZL3]